MTDLPLPPNAPQGQDNAALALLLNRQSCHKLLAPGPNESELELILQAGLRTPDFMNLQPFRFLCARDEAALTRLGEALQRAAIASRQSEVIINRAPNMPHRAPVILIAVCSLKPSDVVHIQDQQFSASSSVLMMQLAARALGYGGVWRSGWPMYDRNLHRELGLSETEQIVGFLYLGTPGHPDRVLEPSHAKDFVTWL